MGKWPVLSYRDPREDRRGLLDGAPKIVQGVLVVMALGVLVVVWGIHTPRVEISKSEMARRDIRAMDEALDAFQRDVGRYPTTVEGLSALAEQPSTLGPGSWRGPYGDGVNVNMDPWGVSWRYGERWNMGRPVVESAGRDGVFGTDDDVVGE